MEKTDDASLVFLCAITDLDPFFRIKAESAFRFGGDVAHERESFRSHDGFRYGAEEHAARFVRSSRPALFNQACLNGMRNDGFCKTIQRMPLPFHR